MPGIAQAKAPPGAWIAAQRKQIKHHISQYSFFHDNNNILKFINDDNNIYTLINFNENNNIYNINNNIFNSKNMNYYKNNIIITPNIIIIQRLILLVILKNNINRKNNKSFEINTINQTKKYIKKYYNNAFNINCTKKIILTQTIIFLPLIL